MVEEKRVGPMSKRELMEALGVEDANPVLRGCLAILKGLEEQMKEQAGSLGLKGDDRALMCGRMSGLIEGQEMILAAVADAQKRKGEERHD